MDSKGDNFSFEVINKALGFIQKPQAIRNAITYARRSELDPKDDPMSPAYVAKDYFGNPSGGNGD